jgi:hypothetical protein
MHELGEDLANVIDYLWQSVKVLLLALVGVIIIITVRSEFRLPWRRSTYGTRTQRRPSKKHDVDPWKASGDRLIVPMPHSNDEDEDADEPDDDADR